MADDETVGLKYNMDLMENLKDQNIINCYSGYMGRSDSFEAVPVGRLGMQGHEEILKQPMKQVQGMVQDDVWGGGDVLKFNSGFYYLSIILILFMMNSCQNKNEADLLLFNGHI